MNIQTIAIGAGVLAAIAYLISKAGPAPPPPPPTEIRVTGAEITSSKTTNPGGEVQFTVDVHNYGDTIGGVNIKLTYDDIEFVGSPVIITDVPPYSDKAETFTLVAPGTVAIYDICAEEIA